MVPRMKILFRVARIANLLDQLLFDVFPKLKTTPAKTTTLHRLLVITKNIYRGGKVMPGKVGEHFVRLGNKMKKLVSHAFNEHAKRSKASNEEGKAAAVVVKRVKRRKTGMAVALVVKCAKWR
jgi:hypothetical protein